MQVSECSHLLESLTRIYHSEADFQHHLAWKIKEELAPDRIRLERRIPAVSANEFENDKYVDLLVEFGPDAYALELKYLTAPLQGRWQNELFSLKDQSAHPVRRYDFVRDISRLEKLTTSGNCDRGFAILLTNDHLYWQEPRTNQVVDFDFRIHEERILENQLEWADRTSDGTKGSSRDKPIELVDRYSIDWSPFEYDVPVETSGNVDFQYLLIEVDLN